MSNTLLEETCAPSPNPAVNIKILPFWAADPMIWFAQVEAQLYLAHAAEKTKFDFIVASLAFDYTLVIRDFILKPPSSNPRTPC